jgi:hypothetical protein
VGFALLKLIQSYLKLNMFASLTLQTEATLEMGHQELLRFEKLVAVRARFKLNVNEPDTKYDIYVGIPGT